MICRTRPLLLLFVFASLFALSACGPSPQSIDSARAEVSAEISSRLGAPLAWDQGLPADSAVADRVAALASDGLSDDDAVRIALLRNPDALAQYEQLSVSQSDLVAAGLLSNPILDLSVRFPDGGGGTNFEAGIVQSFMDLFSLASRRRIAAADFDAAKLDVESSLINLASSVRRACILYRAADAQRSLAAEHAELASASADLAQALHAAGNLSAFDLGLHTAEEAHALAEARAANLALHEARTSLARLLGRPDLPPDWSLTPDSADALPDRELSLESAHAFALQRHPELAAARALLAADQSRLGLAENQPLDDFAVGVDTERDTDGTWLTGPNIEIPLPIFGSQQARRAQLAALFRQRTRTTDALAADVLTEVDLAHAHLLAARASLRAEILHMSLASSANLDMQLARVNAMAAGAFDLIEAKHAEIEARQRLAETRRDYLLARADLASALGGAFPPPTEGRWLSDSELFAQDPAAAALVQRLNLLQSEITSTSPAPDAPHEHQHHH